MNLEQNFVRPNFYFSPYLTIFKGDIEIPVHYETEHKWNQKTNAFEFNHATFSVTRTTSK